MSHQIKFDAKSSIRWDSKVKGGRVVDDFIRFADFVPTFLEIVGIDPACDMTGRSFLPVLLSQKSGIVDVSRDVGQSITGHHVVEVLDKLTTSRGKPKRIQLDNGTSHFIT